MQFLDLAKVVLFGKEQEHSWFLSMYQLVNQGLVSDQPVIPDFLGQKLDSPYHIQPLQMSSWIIHQIVASSSASVRMDFVGFSSIWMTKSSVLMVSLCWQCCFLHQTFATWNLAAFSSGLTLKMNDLANFKSVAIFKSKCSEASEPMALCFFISSVSLNCYM